MTAPSPASSAQPGWRGTDPDGGVIECPPGMTTLDDLARWTGPRPTPAEREDEE